MSGAKKSTSKFETNASTIGYSGKPLWQKLGLKPALRVRLHQAPPDYWRWCGFDADQVTLIVKPQQAFDFGHLFSRARDELEGQLGSFSRALDKNGMLWISWPKKSSGVATDVVEGTLREVALPLGLVDVKVCAVSAVWAGLKFVWRRDHR